MVVDIVFVLLECDFEFLVFSLEGIVLIVLGFELGSKSFDFLGNKRESSFVLG